MSARLRGTRGNVSLLVVIMLPALLVAAGLVLDGGRQLQVRRDTERGGGRRGPGGHAAVRAGDPWCRSRRWSGGAAGHGRAGEPGDDRVGRRRRAVGHGDGHGERRPPHPARLALGVVDVDGHAGRGGVAVNGRRRLRAIAALVATIVLVVGVPLALIAFVGNPWPGRTRLELGDEVALVVGVLAVLAWLVWLRFVVAVVVEVRAQVAELRRPPSPARVRPAAAVAPRRRAARPATRRRRADRAADRATRQRPPSPTAPDARRGGAPITLVSPDGRATGAGRSATPSAATSRSSPATRCSASPGTISATPSAGGRSSSSTAIARSPTAAA